MNEKKYQAKTINYYICSLCGTGITITSDMSTHYLDVIKTVHDIGWKYIESEGGWVCKECCWEFRLEEEGNGPAHR